MFDLNRAGLYGCLEYAASAALMATCAYNLVEAPRILCAVHDCSNVRKVNLYTVFPRSIALGCMASAAANIYNRARASAGAYEARARAYAARFPAAGDKERYRRRLVIAFAAVCAVAVAPANAYRLLLLDQVYRDVALTGFYGLMYVQNIAMNVGEARFVDRCVGLRQRFQTINEEMSALKSRVIAANGYPSALEPGGGGAGPRRDRPGSALADVVELLKWRHRYVSNAVRRLNRLHGLQLTTSVFVLFLMTLTDAYVYLSVPPTKARLKMFYCVWFFQYAFRFCTIVLTTDATAKEANKSKTIITDINHRSIDNSINEELQLFLNEVSSRSVDFTTYDLFIINKYLIISALVTGTSFLVICFQIQ